MPYFHSRLAHAIWALIVSVLFISMFAAFGYTMANFQPDPHIIPVWLWNLCFAIGMLAGITGSGFYLFKLLDELFLATDDPRRVTGKRRVPTPYREYIKPEHTVAWRSQSGR